MVSAPKLLRIFTNKWGFCPPIKSIYRIIRGALPGKDEDQTKQAVPFPNKSRVVTPTVPSIAGKLCNTRFTDQAFPD